MSRRTYDSSSFNRGAPDPPRVSSRYDTEPPRVSSRYDTEPPRVPASYGAAGRGSARPSSNNLYPPTGGPNNLYPPTGGPNNLYPPSRDPNNPRPRSRDPNNPRPPTRDSNNPRPPTRDSNNARPPTRDSNNARPPSRDPHAPRAPSVPSSTNASSSIELDLNRPRPLYRVGWGNNTRGHQGLFLPDVEGSPYGTLYHINIQAGGSSGTRRKQGYEVKEEGFTMTTSRASSAFVINGTMVTNHQVRRATEEVFRNGGDYNMLLNNCQHFCLESVVYMNQLWPNSVTPEAIEHLQVDRPSTLVAVSRIMGRNRAAPVLPPGSDSDRRDSRRSNDRFSIN